MPCHADPTPFIYISSRLIIKERVSENVPLKCDHVIGNMLQQQQQTLRDILELVTQAENQFDIHLLVCVSHHHGLTMYGVQQ